MKTTAPKLTKVNDVWYYTAIIAYNGNKAYKRYYNLNGQLVDSKPIKVNAISSLLRKG